LKNWEVASVLDETVKRRVVEAKAGAERHRKKHDVTLMWFGDGP
jgi:hypothetical protein